MRFGSVFIGALAIAAAGIGLMPAASANDSERPRAGQPTVLHVGDSFVHSGFSQALGPMFRDDGARYIVRGEHSLFIGTIARALNLEQLLWTYRPALVILTIGANEMRMPQPDERIGSVRRLSKMVSRSQCIWVTPPPAPERGQTGIVEVIKRESAPCLVFDSTPVAPSLERTSDKVHPTPEAGALWAKAFWDWLQTQRDPAAGAWALKPRESAAAASIPRP